MSNLSQFWNTGKVVTAQVLETRSAVGVKPDQILETRSAVVVKPDQVLKSIDSGFESLEVLKLKVLVQVLKLYFW